MPTEEDEEEEEETKQEEGEEDAKQEGVDEALEEGKEASVAEGGEATAGAEGGDEDDEEELAKLIKEEDINMVPESTDVTEIDKLTGLPKGTGKYSSFSFLTNDIILLILVFTFRLTVICDSHAGSLHNNQLE